jgi:hypothetical protein
LAASQDQQPEQSSLATFPDRLAQRSSRAVSVEPTAILRARAQKFLGTHLAQSTTKNRLSVQSRFAAFCRERLLVADHMSACMWLLSVAHKASARSTYLSHLRQLWNPRSVLSQMGTALRKQAVREPVNQAIPLTFSELFPFLPRFSARMQAALSIGARGGARVDDVCLLMGQHVLKASPEMVYLWFERTKSSQEDSWRPGLYLGIAPPQRLPNDPGVGIMRRDNNMQALAATLQGLKRNQSLVTHVEMDAALAQLTTLLRSEKPFGRHSLKRGAVKRAITAMAHHPEIDRALLARLERHAEPNAPLQSGDLRYAHSGREEACSIAKLLRTETLTMYL